MSETAIAIFAAGTSLAVDEGFEPPRGQRAAILAVPSSWCLCAGISLKGLPAKGRRQAMLYRLEEKLPLSTPLPSVVTASEVGRPRPLHHRVSPCLSLSEDDSRCQLMTLAVSQ